MESACQCLPASAVQELEAEYERMRTERLHYSNQVLSLQVRTSLSLSLSSFLSLSWLRLLDQGQLEHGHNHQLFGLGQQARIS